jgi:serpin B
MRKSMYMMLAAAMALMPLAAQADDNIKGGTAGAVPSFAFGLFQDVVSNDGSDIVFISPMSASLALSMTANGASETTQQEMLSALGFDCSIKEVNEYNRSVMDLFASEPDGVELNAANSIWVSDAFPLKGRFCRKVRKNYDAMVTNLDFADPASVSVINRWCADNTAGRIDKMIEAIDPTTQLYLLNALYFKGLWTTPFDAALTREDTFHGDSNDSQVKFMHNKAHFPYYMGSEGSMVELPYGEDRNFVMDVIIPADGVSVDEFVAGLDNELLGKFSAGLQTGEIRLMLPSFKAEYEISLNAALQRLGMKEAFTSSADFSDMSKEQLMISEVRQKTFIEVNEEGSEAAAITSVSMMRASLGPEPVRFTVDRPFVFLIRERTSGTVLFMGLVRNL